MGKLHPGKANNFWRPLLPIIAVALLALCSGIAGAAQLPSLPEIPPPIAAAHPDLVQRRAALVQERDALRIRTGKHNSRCGSVEEGSHEAARCDEALALLSADVDRHIQQCDRFITWLASIRDPLPGFTVAAMAGGEFYLVRADGSKIRGKTEVPFQIDNRTELITGSGSVQILLPDETVFTLGNRGTPIRI